MVKTISLKLSSQSIDKAIKELQSYRNTMKTKLEELCRRLAEMGATNISLGYARALYDGPKEISISVERMADGYSIVASGESVLFVEFGAGITLGDGHPQAGEFGMGPGTYPNGKGHWDNPGGWWLPKDKGRLHTYGNPPSMVMYETAKGLEEVVLQVAREVFTDH